MDNVSLLLWFFIWNKTYLYCVELFIVCDSPATPAQPVSEQSAEETLPDDAKCNYHDFEESFMNLTELAVIILYHSNKKLDLPDDSVFTLSSVNVLWCTLLTCKEELRRAIAIPVEKVITCQASKRKLLVEYPGIMCTGFLNISENNQRNNVKLVTCTPTP